MKDLIKNIDANTQHLIIITIVQTLTSHPTKILSLTLNNTPTLTKPYIKNFL